MRPRLSDSVSQYPYANSQNSSGVAASQQHSRLAGATSTPPAATPVTHHQPTESSKSTASSSPRNSLWSSIVLNTPSASTAESRQQSSSPLGAANDSHISSSSSSHSRAPSASQGWARSKTTSSNTPQPPSAAAAPQGSATAGSSSGGSFRSYRSSPSLPAPAATSPTGHSHSNSIVAQSEQLAKIVVAQIFLLLGSVKDEKEKADQIQKLLESNGMEVFTRYFRRLLLTNAPQVFSGRSTDGATSYPALVAEVAKIGYDPSQAAKVAESIEYGDGELFRDFDLSTFMEHFKLNPLGKVALAAALKTASKTDLRTKADAVIASNFVNFHTTIANRASTASSDPEEEPSAEFFAIVIDRIAQNPPRIWTADHQQILISAFDKRYQATGSLVPAEVSSALLLFDLLNLNHGLVQLLKRQGPSATESLAACSHALEPADMRDIGFRQVADCLLFMTIAHDEPPYDPRTFISALRGHRGGQRLDWQDVIDNFDRENLKITRAQFKKLYDALLPLAFEYENFDIQRLWGGDWTNEVAQLTFASAFVSFSEDELDASSIPRLRKSFVLQDVSDAPERVAEQIGNFAQRAVRHPLVSLDAAKALFGMVFRSSETYTHAQNFGVVDAIINPKMDLFVSSVSAVPKPWGILQDQAMKQLLMSLFYKETEGYDFTMHLLWKRDREWLAERLHDIYQSNPRQLSQILATAERHGWVHDLIARNNQLSLDLAALAHGQGIFDVDSWLQEVALAMPKERLAGALSDFLHTKAEDEISVHRENIPPKTVSLFVKTAHALLTFLDDEGLPEVQRTQLQRACIQAYPRLINYGGPQDAVIDESGKNGNALPPEADSKMQEHYKLMYNGERQVREIVEALQKYKVSDDPADQDLFACLIFGLFDEFNCFGEYPLDALATTAVLFGSIINYDLLSPISFQVAIGMVLEAVREYLPEQPMYKFGLQALLHFKDRLEGLPHLSQLLFDIPSLQGSETYSLLQKIVLNAPNGDTKDADVKEDSADNFLAQSSKYPEFTCLSVDPPLRHDFYVEPDETVQENVLFILNNVSDRNVESKVLDLKSSLHEEHLQWFANYLVDSRVKQQPNFHALYLDVLRRLDDRTLWAEVLRETFVCCVRMLNSEATINSSIERTNLKHVASWLGSITIAKDVSIKHRNISFKDLLLEANDSQRLVIAIPFTCKVVAAAADSRVLRPPCAWTMEILEILVELYQFAEIKLNLKFEIEVLLKVFDLDVKDVEPANVIRSKQAAAEELAAVALPENLDPFSNIALSGYSRRRTPADRITAEQMLSDYPELIPSLKHNYTLLPQYSMYQARLKTLLNTAAELAVQEIILPVVERSIEIASVATSELVAKDFATEPSETWYRQSAEKACRNLSGLLASVTCKEPLKVAIAQHVDRLNSDIPEQVMPEGLINLFTSDNLDTLCKPIERNAEKAAQEEVNAMIERELASRRGHYAEPQVNKWAYFIPEPFKPTPGGLTEEQKAIYDDFERGIRRPGPHGNNVSQDISRQLPDMSPDPMIALSAGTASLDNIILPRQGSVIGSSAAMEPQPPTLQPINTFLEEGTLRDRILELIERYYQAIVEAANVEEVSQITDSDIVKESISNLKEQLFALGPRLDMAAAIAGEALMRLLYSEHLSEKLVEPLVHLLKSLCSVSNLTAHRVLDLCGTIDEQHFFGGSATPILIKEDFISTQKADLLTATALNHGKPQALVFFAALVDLLLLSDPPSALRADFANSLNALARVMADEPNLELGYEIRTKLGEAELQPSPSEPEQFQKQMQYQYIFDEWAATLHQDAPEVHLVTFINQLQEFDIPDNRENLTAFLRIALEISTAAFEDVEGSHPGGLNSEAYVRIDSVSKLVVLLVGHYSKSQTRSQMVSSFESLVTPLAMILAYQYHTKGNKFSGRAFFRLFSSLLCDLYNSPVIFAESRRAMVVNMARILLVLKPQIFPGFAYSWLSLVAHRHLLPALLDNPETWGLYSELLEYQLTHIRPLLYALQLPDLVKEAYRGCARLLLVLHHDFPDFLAEYHFQLTRHIPSHCHQLRSLITSTAPPQIEFPGPFTEGLSLERVAEFGKTPIAREAIQNVLIDSGLLNILEKALSDKVIDGDLVDQIVLAVQGSSKLNAVSDEPSGVDSGLLQALVLYVVDHAESVMTYSSQAFTANSIYTQLMQLIMDKLRIAERYEFINAMANQLRYPTSHTAYFGQTLIHMFQTYGSHDKAIMGVHEQIARVLLERLFASRPHSWGLVVTLLELVRNRENRFFELPIFRAAPYLENSIANQLRSLGGAAR